MKLQRYGLVVIIIILLVFNLKAADKKWELEIHYSSWSINFLSSTFIGIAEDEIDDYDPEKGDITFDSYGNNYGIGVRYYPGGKTGSLSFGFSHERNIFKIDLAAKFIKANSIGQQMVVDGSGQIQLNPHSFHFNIRWEIFPSYRVHPYFGLGLGIGVLTGNVQGYATSVTTINTTETIEGVEYDKNESFVELLNEYKEDGKSIPIGFFPFIQMQFGIRGEMAKDVYLFAEIQLYTGLSFRGGIAYRF